MKSRNAGRWGVGVLVWYVTLGTVAGWAQEAAPAAEAPAKPSPWSPVEAVGLAGPLKDYGWEIHGLLDFNYTYNFNNPAGGKNGLLLMNRRADHLALDLANIRIQRTVDGGDRVRHRSQLWPDRRSGGALHPLVRRPPLQ